MPVAISVLLFLGIRAVCAENQALPLDDYTATTWTPREGAPSSITGLAQTTDGTLWIASPRGLMQFDGIRFRQHGERAYEWLPNQALRTLTAPATGGLWIGFEWGGLAFLRDGRLTTYAAAEGVPEGAVRRVLVDRNGEIWIAATAGLGKLVDGRWQAIDAKSGLPPGPAGALLETHSGVIWVLIGDRLFFKRPSGNVFTPATGSDTYSGVGDAGLAEAPDGTVWAIDSRRGLRAAAGDAVRNETLATKSDADFEYRHLLFGPDGVLWYVARSMTYPIPNPQTLRPEEFGTASGLTIAASIHAVLRDREGNLWLGTDEGLTRLVRSRFRVVERATKSRFALIHSTDDSMIWLTAGESSREMVHFQNGHIDWRVPVTPKITAAYRDDEGTDWLSNGEGVWRRDDRSLTLVRRFPNAPAGLGTQALLRDRTGALWCSIERRGVFRYTDGQWQMNGGLEGLPQESAWSMASDAAGRIWLGYASKVGLVNGNKARTFGTADGLPSRSITAIGTRGAHVWVGSEIGLHWFDGFRFVTLQVLNDRILQGLTGIVETANGDVWTAGTNGIARITAGQVERARNKAGRLDEMVQFFGIEDGLPGGVQNAWPAPALVQSGDGKLWVALTGGVAYFDPKDLARNRIPPAVQISALLASGNGYPLEGGNGVPISDPGVKLPPGTTQLRVLYTAHNLTAPERVRFRYRLEGLDKEWQDVGARREAGYTNVGPGKYRFVVTAANNDGVWNETGATLSFSILPAFYETAWFYAACIVAGLAVLAVLYRLRLHQVTTAVRLRLEERIVERERIARELHDTLLQGVQGLILRFQAGTNRVAPDDPARKVLESALERADQVLVESRDRVKGLRASAQMQEDLPSALAKVGEQLAQDNDVTFSLAVEGAPRSLHPILKEEVFLIVREALTNAFQHSYASSVEAEIAFAPTELRLRVRDNGRGIPASILEQGGTPGHWGLAGMRERAERVRGLLEIWSRDGAGTEVQLRIRASLAYREPGNRDVETLVT